MHNKRAKQELDARTPSGDKDRGNRQVPERPRPLAPSAVGSVTGRYSPTLIEDIARTRHGIAPFAYVGSVPLGGEGRRGQEIGST